jgi:hypothetical protein
MKDQSRNIKIDFLARMKQQYELDNEKIFDVDNIPKLHDMVNESIRNQEQQERTNNIAILDEIFGNNLLIGIKDIKTWYITDHKSSRITNIIGAFIEALRTIKDKEDTNLETKLRSAIENIPNYLGKFDYAAKAIIGALLVGNKLKVDAIVLNILRYYNNNNTTLDTLIKDLTQIHEDMLTIEKKLEESKKLDKAAKSEEAKKRKTERKKGKKEFTLDIPVSPSKIAKPPGLVPRRASSSNQ